MPKTSIFYYTNNVVPPKLFNHTFRQALKHCKDNNCELIITSHYPITQSYTAFPLSDYIPSSHSIYKHIVLDISIPDAEIKNDNVKSYVVGQLPYSHESIIKQILFSESKCAGENIILMEHDCLYPDTYIPTVERFLNTYNVTYCSFNIAFLNSSGFFNIENGSFILSTCAFKRDILKGIYDKKLELIKNNKPYMFEPILDIAPKHRQAFYKDEVIVKKHICIDTFLKNKSPLDIKHNFNTDGMLISKNYYHSHPYWRKDEEYINMIKTTNIDEQDQKLWSCGIGKLNY